MYITTNIPEAVAYLERVSTQLRFATSLAINRTVKDVQDGIRASLHQHFIVRRAPFIERGIKIDRGDFSTKDKLEARVHLDEQTDFLAKFETGGIKSPSRARALAIPTAVLVGAGRERVVPDRMRIKQLAMAPHVTKKGKVQVKGIQRTFLVPGLGVFQRVGRRGNARGLQAQLDAGEIRMLYKFKPKVRVKDSLQFVKIGTRIVAKVWADRFYEALEHALATAR